MTESQNYDFRVITFNLLSSYCATKEYYPFVKPQFLDFSSRLNRVKKLIASWTKVNFIICLQEVDDLWYKALEPLFSEKMYGLHSIRYTDGMMGQLIGYPAKHFDKIFVDQFVPGLYVKEIYDKICDDKKGTNDTMDKNNEPDANDNIIMHQLLEASKIPNTMISIGLSAKYYGKIVNKYIIVSTYHMPCKFKDQFLMISHINALKMRLGEIIKKWDHFDSIVLAGDFNMLDTSNEYMYMTNPGAENQGVEELNEWYKKIGFDLKKTIELKSTHLLCHGKEPEYTNCSIKKNKNFVGTLDYVFINDMIGVRSCTVGLIAPAPDDDVMTHLYYKKTKLPLYPNAVCPSDHLALSASLFIGEKNT